MVMAIRRAMSFVFLLMALAWSVQGQAQVMHRIVVPADPPTTDQPPSDPAGTPPSNQPPDVPVPAPTSLGASPAQRAGQGTSQRILPPRAGAGMAAMSPGASMATWYERMPGCAKRISIASLTQIYVIGCSDALDVKVFHWQFNTWQPLPFDAHAIAAVEALPTKKNKFTNLASGIFTIASNGTGEFAQMTGAYFGKASYSQIQEAASGGGWIWAINSASGNHLGGTIRRSDGAPEADCDAGMGICSDYEWNAFGQLYAKRIAAGLSDAVAWAIGEDGAIYRQVNAGVGWIKEPGCATSIANAGSDNVWVIGCDGADSNGNRAIFRWNGNTWVAQPGSGVEIALQADGKPWVLQADGSIWRLR
jgi:hypothetical protein